MTDQIGKPVKNSLQSPVCNPVEDSVWDYVWAAVRYSALEPVSDSLLEAIRRLDD